MFISVPQMWKAPANRFMTQSAKEAGFKYVELVYEPHCAAAYYANNIMNTPSQLSKGDVLIIADIGGGTGDFVSYEFGGSGNDGAKMPLSIVGNPEGESCMAPRCNHAYILLRCASRSTLRLAIRKREFPRMASPDYRKRVRQFHRLLRATSKI